MSEYTEAFGKHVRSLRRARGQTQEVLANLAGLSADTIRRVEQGGMAASIETIRKICHGFGVTPSTMFESFELGRTDDRRELVDLMSSRSPRELRLVMQVVRALLAELDELADIVHEQGPLRFDG